MDQKIQNQNEYKIIEQNYQYQNYLSIMKNNENTVTRKKLQDYSYCLTHNIGKGYSSQVYKGRNDITDQTVAIKVIDMRLLKGQVHKNLLSSEIQVLQSFKRAKNIIQVFQIYSTKNNTYIITEFCEGGDLSRFISSRRGLPQSEAVDILKQIGEGYSQIYSNRIIHRDLKPANILLRDNKVKIADFGFAMKSSQSKKYSSYNVGSPIYMPPEALNDNKYSYKSDIWAIGVIFFQLLTGRTPWKAKTQKQLAKQLSTIPIAKLLPKNISQTSADFLQKALTVSFQKRMTPEELDRYMELFDRGFGNTNSKLSSSISNNNPSSVSTHNPHRPEMISQERHHEKHDSSINKNTVHTPKNARRFTFLKAGEQLKNPSIPKTASTTNDQIQINLAPSTIDKKQISKELLSQIHFCRFVFKLLQRIDTTIDGNINQQLRNSMNGILFQKLENVQNLTCLESSIANQYRKSSDYQKICQIVNQYITKYRKDVVSQELKWIGYQTFETQIIAEIKAMYKQVQSENLEKVKSHVIILDYFITLKQLVNLLQKNDVQLFHGKSKIQAIVEGSPAKVITGEHIRAITAKLRAIKII